MKNNRIAVFILIVIIVFVATFGFAVGVVSVPTIYSFASDQEESNTVPPQYTQVSSNNELGEGFLSYCKSRDSEIKSSTIGASVTAAYNSLAKFCNYAGFNIADLQSHLWYLNENGQTKWFFDSTGINLYNQAFAYLIQENGLEVGDTADVDIYDGDIFIDDDGNRCLVYRIDGTGSASWSFRKTTSDVLQWGSPLKYDFTDLKSMCSLDTYVNLSYNLYGRSYTGNLSQIYKNSNGLGYSCVTRKYPEVGGSNTTIYSCYDLYWAFGADGFASYGNPAILKDNNGKYYIGIIGIGAGNAKYDASAINFKGMQINTTPATDSNTNVTNVVVNFTTNNNVINNNTYEGDTIINNDGDVIYPSDPDPDQPDPGDPTIPYNPYPDNPNYDPVNPTGPGGTTTDPHDTGGGSGEDDTDVTFPDFDFQLPQINWSIGDLSEKFPFSIPFDLVAFFTVMNAEPQAPAIDAEIPLGDWYTWNFQADFSQFDRYAAIIRNVEFIAFCIGLIYLTIRLVRG